MIGLMTALDQEIHEFLQHVDQDRTERWHGSDFHRATIEGHEVVMVKSGVGKVMSAMVASHLIETYSPRALIFTGLGGALDRSLEIGDIVVGTDSVQHDMDVTVLGFPRGTVPYTSFRYISADEELLKLALEYRPSSHRVVPGRVLTGDQFISHADRESHRYLTAELEGTIVDMEGASVALVATVNEVPHVVVRTVSDRADSGALESFEKVLGTASENSYGLVSFMLSRMK